MASFIEKKLAEHGIDASTGKKDSKLKKSKVKKYEDTYRVPIAYVGLLEIGQTQSRGDFEKDYRGRMTFKTDVGEGKLWVGMYINAQEDAGRYYFDPKDEEMVNRFKADPTDVEAETYYQNYKLREENISDFLAIKVNGQMTYDIVTPKGEREVFDKKSPTFRSVEEFLAWVESTSQEAWGEVTIAVNDLKTELAEYAQGEASLPSEIQVNTEMGTLNLKIQSSLGSYEMRISGPGYMAGQTLVDEGIELHAICGIIPIQNPDAKNGSSRSADWTSNIKDRTFTPESYQVACIGRITDKNTQVNQRRNDPIADSWVRDFGYQGALALEDAKQILVQNIAELVEEWKAYVASNRVYETHGHGVGYARTTDQMTPWDYNFGDTYDDVQYDEFQSRELFERMNSELSNLISGYMDLKDNGDGTYKLRVNMYARNNYKEQMGDMSEEQFFQQALDATKTSLQSNGYEVLSVEEGQGYGDYDKMFNFVIRPTVMKTVKMRKSIKKTFDNLMKAMRKSKVKKTPMGLDEYGNSVWIDEKDVTSGLPESFTVNFQGRTVTVPHVARDDGMLGGDISQSDGYCYSGYDGDDCVYLMIARDGRFESSLMHYIDDDRFDMNMDYYGKSNDGAGIIEGFQRFVEQMSNRLEPGNY